jgi:hypothetical protein
MRLFDEFAMSSCEFLIQPVIANIVRSLQSVASLGHLWEHGRASLSG